MNANNVDILDALFRPGVDRPLFDPALARESRDYLESAIADQLPLPATLRVSKATVRRVLGCEAHLIAHLALDVGQPNARMVMGAMADRLFSQVVVGFGVGDSVEDALNAAEAAGDRKLRSLWDGLTVTDQRPIRIELDSIAANLHNRWPTMPPDAAPRLQSSMRVELAGGQVVLSGRVDLAVGASQAGHCDTVLVDAKAGKARPDDREDAEWYALLEVLRSGTQPFQSGNYYLATGQLDLREITADDIRRATYRVGEALNRLSRIGAGEAPAVTPGPLCPWCPAFSACDEGQARIGQTKDSTDDWLSDFGDETSEDDIDG